jgi:hypothetical protein
MKALIKLALAALVTYAAWNAGNAWLKYIRFKDDIEQLAQFGTKLSDDDLRARVLEAASQRSVSLDEGLAIRRDTDHTYVDGSYTESVNVLPWYAYPYTFQIHINALTIQGSLK